MPLPLPTIDEVLVAGSLAGVPVTPSQAQAIIDTVAHFEAPETPCLGLKSWHIAPAGEAMVYRPLLAGDEAFVEAHFHYLPEQLEASPLGLEVTLFNPDGTVRESQDFG
jgi:hypothetical protein